jgi:hypothetical protein
MEGVRGSIPLSSTRQPETGATRPSALPMSRSSAHLTCDEMMPRSPATSVGSSTAASWVRSIIAGGRRGRERSPVVRTGLLVCRRARAGGARARLSQANGRGKRRSSLDPGGETADASIPTQLACPDASAEATSTPKNCVPPIRAIDRPTRSCREAQRSEPRQTTALARAVLARTPRRARLSPNVRRSARNAEAGSSSTIETTAASRISRPVRTSSRPRPITFPPPTATMGSHAMRSPHQRQPRAAHPCTRCRWATSTVASDR